MMNIKNIKNMKISRKGKRLILSGLLVMVIVMILLLDVFSNKEISETTTKQKTEVGIQYTISYEVVNVRSSPEITDCNVCGQLYQNDTVFATRFKRDVDGYDWICIGDNRWIVFEAVCQQ